MANQQNEITLGQFMGVAKKALKRALIYILASVIIVGAALFTVRSFTGYEVSSSKISIVKAEAQTLSTLNQNRTGAVNEALSKFKDGSLKNSDKIIKNLSINAITPENLKQDDTDETFVPTSFNIVLNNDSSLGYTKAEFISLLDGITKELLNSLTLTKMPTDLLTYDIDDELTIKEYFQVATDLYNQTLTTYNTLNNAVNSKKGASTFIGNIGDKSVTLSQVLQNLNNQIVLLDDLKLIIASQKIEKTSGSLSTYLDSEIAKAEKAVIQKQEVQTAAKAVLDQYKAVLTVTPEGNNNILSYNTAEYVSISNTYVNATNNYAEAVKQRDLLTIYKSAYSLATTAGDTAKVVTNLKNVISSVNTLISNFETIAEQFNESIYLTSQATITAPAATRAYNLITATTIIIALVAVALIAFIVAFGQTYGILKKKGYFNGTYVENTPLENYNENQPK